MLLSEKEIAEALSAEEVNQAFLKEILKDYANPNARIAQLARKGVIRRVKRGWYVRGEAYRKRPWSRPYLANVLYTPSYLSLESALSLYGMIPERVERVTSVTPASPRSFDTFLGCFVYSQIAEEAFCQGIDLMPGERGHPSFFIATREKALADVVQQRRGMNPQGEEGWAAFLFDDLRIEEETLSELDPGLLVDAAGVYRSRKLSDLAGFVRRWRERS